MLQVGKSIWNHFNRVVFLTEQMRQAEDLPFQSLLERARAATLTEKDVAKLNSQTVATRVVRGEVPPDRSVIRVNQLREDVNLTQLEIFAKKNTQKIYPFPGRHDAPNVPTTDHALLVRMMFRVGEAGNLKGPGFLERRLAKAKEREQLADERRLEKVKEREQKELLARRQEDRRRREKEQKELLAHQQQDQRCRDREAQDQASLQAFTRSKAAATEQKRLLARQKEDRRRREREARDRACLEALAHDEAAAKVKKAREAEERKLAKLREAERKKPLRDQEKELRRMEKGKQQSAVQAKKVEDKLLRERVERQRNERSLGVIQRQASQSVQEEVVVGTSNNATRLEHELSSVIKLIIRSRLKGYSRKHSQTGISLPSMAYFHLS